MMGLTKVGAFLGALTFVATSLAVVHAKVETNSYIPLTTLQGSVVRVETENALCSGWVLKGSNKVVTAAHCFEDDTGPGPIEAQITFNNGTKFTYVVSHKGDPGTYSNDIAELTPKDGLPTQLPGGLEVCKGKPYAGEPVVMMGNPLNVDHLMFFGRVSNPNYQSDAASPLVDLNGGIFLDIQMWQGNSGGPVIDANTGCVLGSAELLVPINVGGVPIPTGIAYAIPIPNNL